MGNMSSLRGVRETTQGSWKVSHGTGDKRVEAMFRSNQRSIAEAFKKHLIATDMNLTERMSRATFLASHGLGAPGDRVTWNEVVNTGLEVKSSRSPVSSDKWESFARRAVQSARLLNLEPGDAIPLRRSLGDELVAVLRLEAPESTVRGVIGVMHQGAVRLHKSGRLHLDPFANTDLEVSYPVSKRQWEDMAPALEPEVWAAIVRLLPPIYRVPFVVQTFLGLRPAELCGLRLRDFDPENNLVSVLGQRPGSTSTYKPPKTRSSKRYLPVSSHIRGHLLDYIEEHHGSEPGDLRARQNWLDSYVFVGREGAPLLMDLLADEVVRVLTLIGRSSSDVGAKVMPLHGNRALFATLASAETDLHNGVLSAMLGHTSASSTASGSVAPARVTGRYNRPDLRAKVQWMEKFDALAGLLLMSALGDSWVGDCGMVQPISLSEAAEIMGVDEGEVLARVADGSLNGQVVPGSMGVLVVEHGDVADLVRLMKLQELDSYSRAQVREMLQVSEARLDQLSVQGSVVSLGSSTQRFHVTGVQGGVAGGGHRYRKAEIDMLSAEWYERIHRSRGWLRITEAANVLGMSADKVRRLCNREELPFWIDQECGKGERLFDPIVLQQLISDTAMRSPNAKSSLCSGGQNPHRVRIS